MRTGYVCERERKRERERGNIGKLHRKGEKGRDFINIL